MSNTLIKNIGILAGILENTSAPIRGSALKSLNEIKNAFVFIKDDRIADYGCMRELPSDYAADIHLDASGRIVLPSWCDSHTHIVYASSREQEFVDRINGLSYQEIAQRGGGILNSATKLRNASEEELLEGALKRLDEILAMGTGAVEIKSGYGLDVKSELKMLRVIRKLDKKHPIKVRSTFLGAHALPSEFKNDKKGYINLIINEMLPEIHNEKLADFVDIFIEKGYFDIDDAAQIMEASKAYGLIPKVHVNQFNAFGGIRAMVDQNALSVDHLEEMNEEDFEALRGKKTIAGLLPNCSYFLGIPYAPARKMIDQNIAIALATDFNPGSTPSGNMNQVVSAACIKMRIAPEEAINAGTINGAYAMNLDHSFGSITIGKKANLSITKPMDSIAYLPYYLGINPIDKVLISGSVVKSH
jgi:imidazolonepropionase